METIVFPGGSFVMSGPIVRKYGFPNFEQIFGKQEPQHGVDDTQPEPPASPPEDIPAVAEKPEKEKAGKARKK